MKEQLLAEIRMKLTEFELAFQNGDGTDIAINSELLDAEWLSGSKKIVYESLIFADKRGKTVYMYEKTSESGNGLSFGSDSETSFQSGATLFRKVKSVKYGLEGKAYEYNLDLGAIPKAVKEAAEHHGWKFKTVLNKNKAMYPSGKTSSSSKSAVQNNTVSAPAKKTRKKSIGRWFILAAVLFVALIISAVSINIMPYIGLILMLVGIAAALITRKNPRKVVMRSIIAALVLQTLSFMFFAGMMHKTQAIGWVLLGLIVGGIFGFLIKLQRSEKEVFYQQKVEFSVIYLSLLFINQLIGLFFKASIPIVIFLSGLALGLYLGLHLVILIKTRKILKTSALMLLLGLCLLMPQQSLNANAADDEKVFVRNSQGLAYASVSSGLDFQFSLPDGSVVSTASSDNSEAQVTVYSYYPEPRQIIIYVRGNIVPENTDWEIFFDADAIGTNGLVDLDAQGNFSTEGTIQVATNTWDDDGGHQYSSQETWDFAGKVDQSGLSLRITEPNGNFEEMYFEYPPGYFYNTSQSTDALPPVSEQPSADQTDRGTANETPVTAEESDNGNWFAPEGVEADNANTATAVSGIIAGLTALVSILGASLGFSGASLSPLTATSGAPADPNAGPISGSEPSMSEPSDPEPSNPGPSKSEPPQPKPQDTRPPVGTRREDGKVFTKNNGWQNEDFPNMQANSLKSSIYSLQNDLQKYTENGDKLRAEIAKDEIKDSQRQLNGWKEDANIIGKIKSQDNEALYQGQAQKWNERENALETAENTANTISFAADIGLAIGTSGVSSVFTGAKSVSAVKNAITTVKTLTTVKEAATAGANIYDGYARDKNMSGVITKEIVNKGISMGVGKIFDAGKESFGFAKYGSQKSSDSLKILVSSAESSAGNVAQKAAEDSGLTGNITGAVDSADEHFKGVAQNLNDVNKGGDK